MGKQKFRKRVAIKPEDDSVDSQEVEVNEEESSLKDTEKSTSSKASSQKLAEDDAAELIERLKQDVQQNYDKYVRAVADLENLKKRAAKERSELLRYAGENLAFDLLEVVDNLHRAVQATPEEETGSELSTGVKLVLGQFLEVLKKHSITSEDAVGQEFNPEKHEAMCTVPTEEQKPGTVLEQFKAAYFFKGKLLRPAQVVVSAKQEEAVEEEVISSESEEKAMG